MSYDIGFYVETVEPNLNGERFIWVHSPEYDSPTYNLRKMFVAAMDWDYKTYVVGDDGEYHQSYFPMPDVLERIRHGLAELESRPEHYRQYEPENKWGTVESAIECMRNWIHELTPPSELPDGVWVDDHVLEKWPIESLWWSW